MGLDTIQNCKCYCRDMQTNIYIQSVSCIIKYHQDHVNVVIFLQIFDTLF